MALEPHNAKMALETATGRYEFLLPDELSGFYGYAASYEEIEPYLQGELKTYGDQPSLLWLMGKDTPVTIHLELVVGASEKVDTPEDLMQVVTELLRTAHASSELQDGKQDPPEVIALYIGTWFMRNALVKSARIVSLGRPWDPVTGLPYKAVVELELQYIYSKMPSSKDFSFEEP